MTKEDTEHIVSDGNSVHEAQPFEVRPFTTADLDAVIRINQMTLPENYPRHFFLSVHSSCPASFQVATIRSGAKTRLIGYTMARIEVGTSNFSRFKLVRKGHIISVAVLKNFRGIGVAKALLSESLEAIRQRGVSESFLEVRESNLPAVRLYERFGYQIKKRLRKYYRDGEAANLMVLEF
ncbi:MAG: GNAT family N-acetyltransferase [Candidatus Hodarchaeales archaeon]|jgi:ribosomal-protein-alanine N-acetyltransferase